MTYFTVIQRDKRYGVCGCGERAWSIAKIAGVGAKVYMHTTDAPPVLMGKITTMLVDNAYMRFSKGAVFVADFEYIHMLKDAGIVDIAPTEKPERVEPTPKSEWLQAWYKEAA